MEARRCGRTPAPRTKKTKGIAQNGSAKALRILHEANSIPNIEYSTASRTHAPKAIKSARSTRCNPSAGHQNADRPTIARPPPNGSRMSRGRLARRVLRC
jgi:hypothetical protein